MLPLPWLNWLLLEGVGHTVSDKGEVSNVARRPRERFPRLRASLVPPTSPRYPWRQGSTTVNIGAIGYLTAKRWLRSPERRPRQSLKAPPMPPPKSPTRKSLTRRAGSRTGCGPRMPSQCGHGTMRPARRRLAPYLRSRARAHALSPSSLFFSLSSVHPHPRTLRRASQSAAPDNRKHLYMTPRAAGCTLAAPDRPEGAQRRQLNTMRLDCETQRTHLPLKWGATRASGRGAEHL